MWWAREDKGHHAGLVPIAYLLLSTPQGEPGADGAAGKEVLSLGLSFPAVGFFCLHLALSSRLFVHSLNPP